MARADGQTGQQKGDLSLSCPAASKAALNRRCTAAATMCSPATVTRPSAHALPRRSSSGSNQLSTICSNELVAKCSSSIQLTADGSRAAAAATKSVAALLGREVDLLLRCSSCHRPAGLRASVLRRKPLPSKPPSVTSRMPPEPAYGAERRCPRLRRAGSPCPTGQG